MDRAVFHDWAAVFLIAGVLLFGLSMYYAHAMNRAVLSRLPPSRWDWLLVWFAVPSMHGFYFPDSTMRKKYYFSSIGMVVCLFVGFRLWMK